MRSPLAVTAPRQSTRPATAPVARSGGTARPAGWREPGMPLPLADAVSAALPRRTGDMRAKRGMAFGSADRSAHVAREAGDDPDATAPPAALAQALGQLWTAVHHLSEEARASLDTAPPRLAIDEWCWCMLAFDALAYLADYLDLSLQIPEEEFRNAPYSARSRLSDDV